MTEKNYIPGFDWVRLVGSIVVMISHYGVFSSLNSTYPTFISVFSNLVPLFFITSGYLRGRDFSKKRVFRQVVKYGAIYLLVETCVLFHTLIADYLKTGQLEFLLFFKRVLKRLVYRSNYNPQLWFIPILLYSLLINAFLDGRKRRVLIALSIALFIFYNVDNGNALRSACDKLITTVPVLEKAIRRQELHLLLSYFLKGFVFTSLGVELVHVKIHVKYLLWASIPFLLFDLTVRYTGVSKIPLSLLLFVLIQKLPGRFLFPYHMEISIFAGVMYFFHMIEKRMIYNHVTDNVPVNIIAITVFNLLITGVASAMIRKRKMARLHELQ